MNNLYLDLYALQSVPASNINSDDTGAPKKVTFGGALRSRVSSQALKRAMRDSLKKQGFELGIRTKKILELFKDELSKQGNLSDDEAEKKAKEILKVLDITISTNKKDKDKTKVLLVTSPKQIKNITKYVLSNGIPKQKKELSDLLYSNNSIDIALFGRMMAGDKNFTVDATAQVAHAVSTHEIEQEFDYFTAIDDLKMDTTGAEMIDNAEYNSSTLYRYANVSLHELIEKLGEGDAQKGVRGFVKAFILSMPTGRQNSYANKTLPGYVMVSLRKDTPVNLVSAFEEPVESTRGYMGKSVERLNEEYDKTLKFVEEPIVTLVLSKENWGSKVMPASEYSEMDGINQLLDTIAEKISYEVKMDEDTNN